MTHAHTATTVADEYFVSAATCTSNAVYYKSCPNCGEKGTDTFGAQGTMLGHVSSSWIIGETQHYKYCTRCKKNHSNAYHNNNTKILIEGNNEKHATKCKTCGVDQPDEPHEWKDGAGLNGTDGVHECACGHLHEIPYHYFPNIFLGDNMEKSDSCPVCGQGVFLTRNICYS